MNITRLFVYFDSVQFAGLPCGRLQALGAGRRARLSRRRRGPHLGRALRVLPLRAPAARRTRGRMGHGPHPRAARQCDALLRGRRGAQSGTGGGDREPVGVGAPDCDSEHRYSRVCEEDGRGRGRREARRRARRGAAAAHTRQESARDREASQAHRTRPERRASGASARGQTRRPLRAARESCAERREAHRNCHRIPRGSHVFG